MEYRNIANKSVLLPYRTISNLQCNIHITSLAFNVISIERFRIPAFQDETLATRLTIVQAFPGFEDVGSPFFWGGAFYLRWLHGFFKLNDSHLNHSIQLVLKDAVGLHDFILYFSVYQNSNICHKIVQSHLDIHLDN